MRAKMAAVLAGVTMIASPAMAAEPGIGAGMNRHEVEHLLGRPDYERLERNGVRCLAYRTRAADRYWPKPLLPRDGFVVALRDGRVIGADDVLYAEISTRCSQMAERFDRAPRNERTCYRKLYLRCE
jgi:hypothetical protein